MTRALRTEFVLVRNGGSSVCTSILGDGLRPGDDACQVRIFTVCNSLDALVLAALGTRFSLFRFLALTVDLFLTLGKRGSGF